jgi:hypothetical protein
MYWLVGVGVGGRGFAVGVLLVHWRLLCSHVVYVCWAQFCW